MAFYLILLLLLLSPLVSSSSIDMPAVLDGGAAWIYVGASFLHNGIIDGICNSAGLLIPAYETHFHVSTAQASWPISVMISAYLLSGTVVAGLLRRLGPVKVTMTGGIIASIAILSSVFAPNLIVFIICCGICGIGFGCIYLPSIVVVTENFELKRAMATGFVVSGTGVGSFFLTYVIPMLSLSGLSWQKIHLYVYLPLCFMSTLIGVLYRKPKTKTTAEGEKLVNGNGVESEVKIFIDEVEENGWESPIQPRQRLNTHSGVFTPLLPNDDERMIVSSGHLNTLDIKDSVNNHHISPSGSFRRKDMLYSGSLTNLSEFKKKGNMKEFRQSMIIFEEDKSDESTNMNIIKKILRFFIKNLSFDLLKNIRMNLIFNSNLVAMLAFYIPQVFVIQLALSRNLDEKELTWLVPSMNISNTIARILVGILADRQIVKALTINNVGLIIGGILTILVSLASSIEGFMAYMILYGIVIAPYISLTSIYTTDIVGIENLSGGMGLITLSRGIASLFGTPLAGFIQQKTQSYPITFAICGGLFILAGIISSVVNCLSTDENKTNVEERTNGIEIDELRKSSLPTIPENSEDSFEDLADSQNIVSSSKLSLEVLENGRKSSH